MSFDLLLSSVNIFTCSKTVHRIIWSQKCRLIEMKVLFITQFYSYSFQTHICKQTQTCHHRHVLTCSHPQTHRHLSLKARSLVNKRLVNIGFISSI